MFLRARAVKLGVVAGVVGEVRGLISRVRDRQGRMLVACVEIQAIVRGLQSSCFYLHERAC